MADEIANRLSRGQWARQDCVSLSCDSECGSGSWCVCAPIWVLRPRDPCVPSGWATCAWRRQHLHVAGLTGAMTGRPFLSAGTAALSPTPWIALASFLWDRLLSKLGPSSPLRHRVCKQCAAFSYDAQLRGHKGHAHPEEGAPAEVGSPLTRALCLNFHSLLFFPPK